jgi:hypothetical protein
MTSARHTVINQLQFGMLIVDVSEVKFPGEAKRYNLPPDCVQSIDVGVFGENVTLMMAFLFTSDDSRHLCFWKCFIKTKLLP